MNTPSTSRNPRRMTLAGIPSSRDGSRSNRRPSIDPSSAAAATSGLPKRPPKGRVSMIPRMGRENVLPPPYNSNNSPSNASVASVTSMKSTASSRRRSVGPNGGGITDSSVKQRRQSLVPPPQSQRTDPRPINDKSYQMQCIKELLSFLKERGYEFPVSSKSLMRPSSKDFQNICTFMLRQADKDFGRGTTMKFEDEVALNFKAMGYPFTVSKTSLVAAGSPHTWPSLLAALTWLMYQLIGHQESVAYENQVETVFETVEGLTEKTDADFFRYVGQAYKIYLADDQEALYATEAAYTQGFEKDNDFIETMVDKATDINATIVERIHELEEQTKDLPEQQNKRENYATDLEQFQDMVRQMDEHKSGLEQQVKDRTEQLADTNKRLDKMTTYIDNLKQTIKEQEFSVDDIYKLESEIKGLCEASDRAHALLDQQRKALLGSEQDLMKVCNTLDAMTDTYNSRVAELQLVPELSAKFASLTARLDKDQLLADNQARILGVDLVGTSKPVSLQSKKEFVQMNSVNKVTYNDLFDELNRSDDARTEAEAKLKIVQDKTVKCDGTLESEEETHQAKLTIRQREVENMENKSKSLQNPVALEEQMAAYERKCAELEAQRQERHEKGVAQYNAVLDEVSRACEAMADHDAYFRQRVDELHKFWQDQVDKIPAIQVPRQSTEES